MNKLFGANRHKVQKHSEYRGYLMISVGRFTVEKCTFRTGILMASLFLKSLYKEILVKFLFFKTF